MMGDIDFSLFWLFRRFLFIVLAVYTLVRLIQFIYHVQLGFDLPAREGRMMRRYLQVQILRIPIRRFIVDLAQIAVLVMVFIWLLAQHV